MKRLALLGGLLLLARSPDPVRAGPPPPAESTSVLAPATLDDPSPLPFDLVRELGDALPDDLAGPGLTAVRKDPDLLVDPKGDGKSRTRVTRKKPGLLRAGTAAVPVFVWWDGERWAVGPAAVLSAKVGAIQVQVLAATLAAHGKPSKGWIRLGAAAFRPLLESNRLQEEGAWLELAVRKSGEAVSVTAKRTPKPSGQNEDRWRGLLGVNRFRDVTGLEPLDLDETRSVACQAHAEYIRRNPAEGPTHVEIPGRPGYSPEGAQAAEACVMELTGDTELAARRLSMTMLHRIPFLHETRQRLGVGAVHDSAGRVPNGPPGYTVLWGGQACSTAVVPIVVPAPGQEDAPRSVIEEIPEPEKRKDWYAQPRGYPISVSHLPLGSKVSRFVLRRVKGDAEVEGLVFTSDDPIHSAHAHNQCSAFLLPNDRLEEDAVYRVFFAARAGDRDLRLTWTFKTSRD